MRIRTLLALLAGSLTLAPVQAADTSVSYPAKAGAGRGRHVVFLAGDEEYRSEEGLPMLAKILSQRHGFKCTVLFSVDPDGTINPKNGTSLSDPAALDTADAIVMLLRFRAWPDEDMARFDKFLRAGKPIVALRTSTHAFNGFPKGSPWESWNYNNQGGFGKRVLGETWLTHWGKHKVEATRGLIEPSQRGNPLLRGITSIFGDTDVYEAYPPPDATVLVRGLVLQGMTADSPPADYRKPRSTDKQEQGINDPPMPVAWTRLHRNDNGTTNRILATTMGSATDLENEGLRRLVINGVYWGLGLDVPARADVTYVDEFNPSFYGFDGFRKGLRASDFGLGRKVPGQPLPRPGRGGFHPSAQRTRAGDPGGAIAPAPQPAADDRGAERRRMVDVQLRARDIRSAQVLEAMGRVPRHLFVPDAVRPRAYADHPLPIGYDQTISQPYIVAFMTEALDVARTHKVLEIGTGSGYQAAVLAELAREVYTIEIVEPLAARARQTLSSLGYRNIDVRAGNGYLGWPEHAPYDRIMVTAAPETIPPALVGQLKLGGLMAIPVGTTEQELRIVRRTRSGLETLKTLPVQFVPMTGKKHAERS